MPADGRTPLDHALGDGEDFELVLAMPPAEARRLVAESQHPPFSVAFTIIGQVVAGAGLFASTATGDRRPLSAQGFIHALDVAGQ